MLDTCGSLLDQITVVHGPYDLLQRYFAVADEITHGLASRRLRLKRRVDS